MNSLIKNIVLISIVVLFGIIPLYILKDAEFVGADSLATQAITQINSAYKPWFEPILRPKSSEVESLLFAIQASIGSGIVGYGFGYLVGIKNKRLET
jgi:cobalt/nickel transport protein